MSLNFIKLKACLQIRYFIKINIKIKREDLIPPCFEFKAV